MKTTHDTSQLTGQCHDHIASKNPSSVTEFIRNLLSPNQDFELNKTEEELLEEWEVLTARRNFTSLATRNLPLGATT
jgi:hypothetical protein